MENNDKDNAAHSSETSPIISGHANEVRYSLKELMDSVVDERRMSALGRELVDVNEIEKMFSKTRRRKQS